jgi:hypothetical protein
MSIQVGARRDEHPDALVMALPRRKEQGSLAVRCTDIHIGTRRDERPGTFGVLEFFSELF